MGRTVEDLIMLDSIVRKPNCTTDGKGAIPDMVSCDVEVDRNLDLSGIRLGLPSTAGWGTTGISNEIAEVVQAALDKMKAAGVTLVPFDSSAINAAQKAAWPMGLTPGGFEVGVSTARWLYLHNYTLSLPELVSQINRPDTKTGYESYLTSYDNTTGGSDVNEINYLQEGRPHLTQAWIDAIEDNKVDALLYPAFRTEITRIDAGDSLNVITNATGTYIVDYYNDAMLYFLDAQAGITVGAFPIGMGSTGTPAGLQVASVPGDDETVMSLMLAFEKLLGPMPPPPRVAACSGCTANVTNVKPTYTVANVSAPLNSSGVWTQFGLTFGGGNCYQSTLNTYGQNGPYGVGLPVPNTTATHTVTGTTTGSVASTSIG